MTDQIRTSPNSKAYDDGYDKIFGAGRKIQRGSWVQDPDTGKLVPRDEYVRPSENRTAAVHGPLEAFKSPIDGSIIDDRAKLRAHNKAHGVTNISDYGENNGKAYFDRHAKQRSDTMTGATKAEKRERIEVIKHAIDMHTRR